MPHDYPWQCLVCSASNDAASRACAQCGFPARATGREIAKAQADYRAAQVLAENGPPTWPAAEARGRPGAIDDSREATAPMSAGRLAVATAGLALMAGGLMAFKVAWSSTVLGWGAASFVVGCIVGGLAAAGARPADAG